ncbi:DUF1349 domain-containing protein [Bacteroidota bacterium]
MFKIGKVLFTALLLLLIHNNIFPQISDDFFNDTQPKTFWEWYDPVGDVDSNFTGTNVEIIIPSGTSHDLGAKKAPRFLQSIPDTNFGVEVKFESGMTLTYQMQGIVVQNTLNNFIRFGSYSTNTTQNLFVAYYNPTQSVKFSTTLDSTFNPSYLRVVRNGNDWTFSYSYDDSVWADATTFTQAMTVQKVGFYAGIHNPNPSFISSVDYFKNIYDSTFTDTDSAGVTPPIVNVWYGDTQTFGNLGNPQQWVNILGNVSDANGISSLKYNLNGGLDNSLSIGPNGTRLVSGGDYVIEIDKDDLNSGSNTVEIIATDNLSAVTSKTVTINYNAGNIWPLPYTADWSTISNIDDINQVANIVDGLWELTPEGIHTVVKGYDRLIVIGDETWGSNLEVTIPMTIHSASGGAGVGFALGWQGHTGGTSPRTNWPLEAIGWVRNPAGSSYLEILTYPGTQQGTQNITFDIDTTYLLKIKSEEINFTDSRFQVKIWEDGTPEPINFQLSADIPSRDGSILMITHRADVTWGNVGINSLSINHPPQFTSSPITSATESTLYSYNITTSDADPGEILTITTPVLPSWLTFTDYGDGTALLSGTPGSSNLGINHVELEVEDTAHSTDSQLFDVYVSPAGSTFLISDHFCVDDSLNPLWSIFDPYDVTTLLDPGESTVSVLNSNLEIDIPAGFDHNLWSGSSNLAPRVLQNADNSDFRVEVKFLSVPSQQFQMQGLVVQQDNDTFLRFEVFHDGTNVKIFAAYIDGTAATAKLNSTLAEVPEFLRIERDNDSWTFSYLDNTSTWIQAVTFTQTITVTEVGIHGGNTGSNPPAFTAIADYFWNLDESFPGCKNLELVSPNGGETWNVGDSESITWMSNNINNVMLELSTNNGVSWSTIETSLPASPASYNVTVPNSPSNECLVRISDVDELSVNDVSNNFFTIQTVVVNNKIIIGTANSYSGSTVGIPVELIMTPGFEFNYLLQGTIHYDPSKLLFKYGDYGSGSIPNIFGWGGVFYSPSSGTVNILLTGSTPINQSGQLFDITFQIIDNSAGSALLSSTTPEWIVEGTSSPFEIKNGVINYAGPPPVSTNRGDATLNFLVEFDDALSVLYHFIGYSLLNGQALINADADLSGTVNIYDFISIIFYIYLHTWDYPFLPPSPSAAVSFDNGKVSLDNIVTLPINASNTENIRSVEIKMEFDTDKFEYFNYQDLTNANGTYVKGFSAKENEIDFVVVTNADLDNQHIGNILLKRKGNSNNENSEIKTLYSFNKGEYISGPTLNIKNNLITSLPIEEKITIKNFELLQNYPNPFNPATNIKYTLPERTFVTLKVYNILGKEIRILVNEVQLTGIYNVEFDASNLPSGIYLYKLQTQKTVLTKKMILIK